MKKWILIGGGVVIFIIIFLVVGISNLGPMIKSAVNTYGPRITKTEVRLADVSVSIFSGEANLKDFYLGNPKGFKSPKAISVGSIHVDVDEGSVTGETIIIDKIEVVRPEVTYEKLRGTDNFRTILNNVKSTVDPGEPSKKQPQKEGEGKKILIRNFIVSDGKVNLAMSVLAGKTVSASLPDIHLKDIGKKKNGASPAEAFEEVFAALYENIISPAVTDTLNQGLKALGSNIGIAGDRAKKQLETAGEDAKKEVEAVTDKVKGLFGK
ncbi:MAG: hypothetical protein JW883_04515 [Deltaproteobacteria bacterium]|nr:hypothetical protein [Deltaproteobacteria bacterium]